MDKKIAILTVHKGINIGSYLQAYALKTAVEKQDCSVKLIDNKSRLPKRTMLSTIKNHLLAGNIKKAIFSYRLFSNFIKAHKAFDEVPLTEADSFDCVILGSDEIWNVKRKVMKDYPSFFGTGISTKKIAYAPSVNNADLDDLKEDYIINALKEIEHISVRDIHSKEVIEDLSGKAVSLVCDPTWLLKPDEYPIESYNLKDEKYILVYMYNSNISENEIKAMTELAKKNGLKLISVNNRHQWCDRNITATPFQYLDILKKSQFVLTNTFHGTILSILFNKPFAAYEKSNRKVSEILKYIGLTERKINTDTNDINIIYNNKIDWMAVNEKISQLRKQSTEFLSKSFE